MICLTLKCQELSRESQVIGLPIIFTVFVYQNRCESLKVSDKWALFTLD